MNLQRCEVTDSLNFTDSSLSKSLDKTNNYHVRNHHQSYVNDSNQIS